jgi:VWFA-related protein
VRLIFAFLIATALASPQEGTVFRANVILIHVDAEVLSADGRVLNGFTKDDFRILDERKEQPIAQFSTEEQPLDLILLFDVSGSMDRVVADVSAAAHQGLHELRQGDRVAVWVFNNRSREVAGFTENLDEVERTIQDEVLSLQFGGGTLIQQAVSDAAMRFRRESKSQRRRAVLIVTDNMGQRTRRDESVIEELWESDAILSGLIVRNSEFQARRAAGVVLNPLSLAMEAGMKGIAEKTGGDAITANATGTAFQEAMHRIRARYSLYYVQPAGKAGVTHSIQVELTSETAKRYPKARVRTRTGYVSQASGK